MKKIHICPSCGEAFRCGTPYAGPLNLAHRKILEILGSSLNPLTSREIQGVLYSLKFPIKLGSVQGRLCELRDLERVKLRLVHRVGYWSLAADHIVPLPEAK